MPKSATPSRKTNAVLKKKKIYDVSIKMMKKHGFEQVTVADISKKAGISIGTFYHYFESKSDIFNEIYRQADDYFDKEVAMHLGNGSALDRIRAYFQYYAQFNMSNGIDFVKQLYNTQNKLFIKKDRCMQKLLQRIIKEGQEANEISSVQSPEEMTNTLFIFVRGVIFDWCLHDGSYDLASFVDSQLSCILLYIKI